MQYLRIIHAERLREVVKVVVSLEVISKILRRNIQCMQPAFEYSQ